MIGTMYSMYQALNNFAAKLPGEVGLEIGDLIGVDENYYQCYSHVDVLYPNKCSGYVLIDELRAETISDKKYEEFWDELDKITKTSWVRGSRKLKYAYVNTPPVFRNLPGEIRLNRGDYLRINKSAYSYGEVFRNSNKLGFGFVPTSTIKKAPQSLFRTQNIIPTPLPSIPTPHSEQQNNITPNNNFNNNNNSNFNNYNNININNNSNSFNSSSNNNTYYPNYASNSNSFNSNNSVKLTPKKQAFKLIMQARDIITNSIQINSNQSFRPNPDANTLQAVIENEIESRNTLCEYFSVYKINRQILENEFLHLRNCYKLGTINISFSPTIEVQAFEKMRFKGNAILRSRATDIIIEGKSNFDTTLRSSLNRNTLALVFDQLNIITLFLLKNSLITLPINEISSNFDEQKLLNVMVSWEQQNHHPLIKFLASLSADQWKSKSDIVQSLIGELHYMSKEESFAQSLRDECQRCEIMICEMCVYFGMLYSDSFWNQSRSIILDLVEMKERLEDIINEKTINLKDYQLQFVEKTLISKKTIILADTGTGKTLVAAEVIRRTWRPGDKFAFIVPTQPLVLQQAAVIRDWTELRVVEHKASSNLNIDIFDVVVCTPQALENALIKCKLELNLFRGVIFDEVHHLTKNHPYAVVAKRIRKLQTPPEYILGMTATLSFKTSRSQIKRSIANLMLELRSNEILQCDIQHNTQEEVKDYILEYSRKTLNEYMKYPDSLDTMLYRCNSKNATSFCQTLFEIVRSMEEHLRTFEDINVCNESPILALEKFKRQFKYWGTYADALQKIVNDNSKENHAKIMMLDSVKHWYDALRLMATSFERDEDLVYLLLKFYTQEGEKIQCWPDLIRNEIRGFWEKMREKPHPRLMKLKEILEEYYDKTEKFHGIVFVQERLTVHLLDFFIKENLDRFFKSTMMYSLAKNSSYLPYPSLNKDIIKKNLLQFRNGDCNLLICTAVAEEGLDIPEANIVIKFNPVQTPVSLTQAKGRGRKSDSVFIIMQEKNDENKIQKFKDAKKIEREESTRISINK